MDAWGPLTLRAQSGQNGSADGEPAPTLDVVDTFGVRFCRTLTAEAARLVCCITFAGLL
jgi:hypothetical protein